MNGSVNRGWLRFYLALAPAGTLLATAGIIFLAGEWPPWNDPAKLEFTGKLIPLGGVCYGAIIWALELVGAFMLWAWSQYQNRKNANRQKIMAEVIKALQDAGVQIPGDIVTGIVSQGMVQKDRDHKEPATV